MALLLLVGSAQASNLIVCPNGCGYASIQAAIDAANSGDSIEIYSGHYYEQIILNKNVTLKGINNGGGKPLVEMVSLCGYPESLASGITILVLSFACPSSTQSNLPVTVPKTNKTAAPALPPKNITKTNITAVPTISPKKVTKTNITTAPVIPPKNITKANITTAPVIAPKNLTKTNITAIPEILPKNITKTNITIAPVIPPKNVTKANITNVPVTTLKKATKTSTVPPVFTPTSEENRKLLYYGGFSLSQPVIYPPGYNREYTAAYKSGRYHITVSKPNCISIVDPTGGATYGDFTIEVEVVQEGGPKDGDYGFILRRIDQNSYYRFIITGNGYYGFDKYQDGNRVELVPLTKSEDIRSGKEENTIKVGCYGDHFTFNVNGNDIGGSIDGSFAYGGIGLEVGTQSAGGVHVSFDNLRIWA